MKLVTFCADKTGSPQFGFIYGDEVISFGSLKTSNGGMLTDMNAYLAGLPESHQLALKLEKKAVSGKGLRLETVKLLAPLQNPAGLIDFGLSPRHLVNSARTMFRHEFGRIIGGIAASFIGRKIRKKARQAELSYYKGNHQAVSGPADKLFWPLYTSYLDIEPELAFVTGNEKRPVAGYLIFNDISARDVQFPEMIGSGPARSKDFGSSNCIGPYLLTADELPDPLALQVHVSIGSRYRWQGSSSEYTCRPEEVLNFLNGMFVPAPGTIIGMGTIPGCTGMDNDQWLQPGDEVSISFDALGTLVNKIPEPVGILQDSRWKNRAELSRFYAK